MIAVEKLFKRHLQLEIIRGIDLHVAKGEVAVIIGPSGGGKSTFLRCINGLEVFQSGTVKVGDLTLQANTLPDKNARHLQLIRQRVGFVFQQFNLFPHKTVLENVMEAPIQVLKHQPELARAAALELLGKVGLAAKADALPRQLSGGQQQRVAICRTLAMQPEAILFDEPTSALDPVMANEVQAVMAQLAAGGQTMIVVTHSMRFARSIASHVHVFAGGHDVECGPPNQVFEAPQHDITKSFLAEAKG